MAVQAPCPECGSTELVIADRVSAGDGNLCVTVPKQPGAGFFSSRHASLVKAVFCGRCGYIKFFVENPQELLAIYRQRNT